MKTTHPHPASAARSGRRRCGAFTLVEIAVAIGIVGFALVAIIGVLPAGMDVQKQNKDDTIINLDGPLMVDAIRSGITNLAYVPGNLEDLRVYRNGVLITNFPNPAVTLAELDTRRILGIMSQPKYTAGDTNRWFTEGDFLANSGPLSLEANNARALAFKYRVRTEIIPYRSSYNLNQNFTNNLHEIKVIFTWPVFPNGKVGNGEAVYRTMAFGQLESTNEVINGMNITLFRFRPDVFSIN